MSSHNSLTRGVARCREMGGKGMWLFCATESHPLPRKGHTMAIKNTIYNGKILMYKN